MKRKLVLGVLLAVSVFVLGSVAFAHTYPSMLLLPQWRWNYYM